jgi:hypothetical protein
VAQFHSLSFLPNTRENGQYLLMSGAAQIKAMTAPLPRQHSNENGETNANSTDNNINSIKTNGGNAHSQQQHKDGKHGGGGQEQPTTSLTIKNAGGTTSRAITDLGAQSNSSRFPTI